MLVVFLVVLGGDNIINNYFAGTITDLAITNTSNIGGIIGGNDSNGPPFTSTSTNFWDIDVDSSIIRSATGGDGDSKSFPKNTVEMQNLETFSNWDISAIADHNEEIWYINEGKDYPRLGWEIKEFVLTYLVTPSQGGEITGSSTQTVYRADDGLEITAIPAEGWEFVSWDDELVDNSRIDLLITTDLTATANFSIKQYEVVFKDHNGNIIVTEIVNHGNSANAPLPPIREGYTFSSWNTTFNNVTEDLEIIAQYSENPINNNNNSAPYTPPPAIGSGKTSMTVPMNSQGNLGLINSSGLNFLSFIGSKGSFATLSSSGENSNHSIAINNLDLLNNKIKFTIQSTPQEFELNLGEEVLVDIDQDGVKDIMVKFVNILVNRAELTIKSIINAPSKYPEIKAESKNKIDKQAILQKARQTFTNKNLDLVTLLSGRILLQVEEHGQAWYLDPISKQRYFLGRPDDAFNLMRQLGLGISEDNYYNFRDNGVPKKFAGQIFLRVESNGEAYYINPVDMKMNFLGRPADAFSLMRELALGINNQNINQIPVKD